MSPWQQEHVDYLVRTYEDGKLNVQTYQKDVKLTRVLSEDFRAIVKLIVAAPKTKPSPYLPSYHPSNLTVDEAFQVLSRIAQRGQNSASASSRFESAIVRERVLQSELSIWWSAFIPGSRVLFLPFSESKALVYKYAPLYKPTTLSLSTAVKGLNIKLALPRGKEPWFFIPVFVSNLPTQANLAIVVCPEVPIPNDPARIQELLKLTSDSL